MNDTTSREQILKRVRSAGMQKAPNSYSDIDLEKNIYHNLEDDLEVVFAEEFTQIGGQFVYCQDINELSKNLKELFYSKNWEEIYTKSPAIEKLLSNMGIDAITQVDEYSKVMVSITECEALVARLGSIMVSSKQITGRRLNFIPDTHIVIANLNQLVETVKDAMLFLDKKYEKHLPSMTTLITGPSRTADIEKTLVMGAHGPRNLIVFLTEENFLS